MQLSYFFTTHVSTEKFLPALSEAASSLGVELVAAEDARADFFFYTPQDQLPVRTGLKLAAGKGWTPALCHEKEVQFKIGEELHPQAAGMLVAWVKERQMLRAVSPMRHQLGNLVVILLGRIMRMKQGDGDDHIESLEALHVRMTNLYQEFDGLEVPRY